MRAALLRDADTFTPAMLYSRHAYAAIFRYATIAVIILR